MKNFSYHTQAEKDSLEAVLRRRKRKVNRQQIVAMIITIVLLGMLAMYFAFHTYYSEFDGYVHVDANKVRTPFDIYLDSVYVKEGDIIGPGDTLYSYYNIEELVEHFNINSEPVIVSRYRDLSLQAEQLRQQLSVSRARIKELQAQISVEDHNISFGLSSNSHKLDLERDLNVERARLQSLLDQLSALNNIRNAVMPSFKSNGTGGNRHSPLIYDDYRSQLLREAKNYHLASDSSIVSEIMAPARMVFFKKEEILTTQHIDLDANNLKIIAYVPVDKMHRITNNSSATVVINTEFSFDAHVTVLGMRAEEIPESLRSYFNKKNTMLIAVLEFDPGQYVPFWALADGLPVSVRVRNIETFIEKPSAKNYIWYKTGEGVQSQLPLDWIYPDSAAYDSNTATEGAADHLLESVKKQRVDTIAMPDSLMTVPASSQTELVDALNDSSIIISDTTNVTVVTILNENGDSISTVVQQKAKTDSLTVPKHDLLPYYIIVGSLPTQERAQAEMKRLGLTDNPRSGIRHNSNRKWHVYITTAPTRKAAQDSLVHLRRIQKFSGAWIWTDIPSTNLKEPHGSK